MLQKNVFPNAAEKIDSKPFDDPQAVLNAVTKRKKVETTKKGTDANSTDL